MLGYSLHYCNPIDRRRAQVVCSVCYVTSLMDVTTGGIQKADCVTYVTVKELGGNHFVDRCYDCFC